MIIHNPTDTKVEITVGGVTKSVEPQSETVVDDLFGDKWIKTHEFLQAVTNAVEALKEEVPAIKKEVEEAIEEVQDVIEVVEDAFDRVMEKVTKAKKK